MCHKCSDNDSVGDMKSSQVARILDGTTDDWTRVKGARRTWNEKYLVLIDPRNRRLVHLSQSIVSMQSGRQQTVRSEYRSHCDDSHYRRGSNVAEILVSALVGVMLLACQSTFSSTSLRYV
jgi:hypothetical protein